MFRFDAATNPITGPQKVISCYIMSVKGLQKVVFLVISIKVFFVSLSNTTSIKSSLCRVMPIKVFIIFFLTQRL